jgi:hypothetical protein
MLFGRQMVNASVGMICRHYPQAAWACGVQKYLAKKVVAGVSGYHPFKGQFNPNTGAIELNAAVLAFGLQTAFTLIHEVAHRVDHLVAPNRPRNRVEFVTRALEGEALAESFALMAFAEYMAISGRLDHLDDKTFWLAAGIVDVYDTAINTTDGRAFVNYMMDHPAARSDNDPEVFRLAYAAGLAWVANHADYYVPHYGGP